MSDPQSDDSDEIDASPADLRQIGVSYAALSPLVALLVTAFQVYRLSFARMLPDEYFGTAALVNFVLAMACAIGAAPLLLLLIRFWKTLHRFRPGTLAAFAAVVGTYGPLWLLNLPNDSRTSQVRSVAFGSLALLVLLILLVPLFRRLPLRSTLVASLGLQAFLMLAMLTSVLVKQHNFEQIAQLDLAPTAKVTPHVFVILIDTLRADHLSVYGYDKPTSPNLEAFAREAVLFERAFGTASWTRPSCASLFTGLYPPDFGGLVMGSPLRDEIPILPQFLHAEGYDTAGIVASLHVSPLFGFQKGFDLLDNGDTFLRSTGSLKAFERLGLLEPRVGIFDADVLTSRAIRWIDSREQKEGPLFLYLHYTDPHRPYDPPEQFHWRKFATPRAAALDDAPMGADYEEQIDPVSAEAMVAAYDGEIRSIDETLGRLIDYLKEQGLYDESLIILTADHGEEFNEHGGWAHAKTLYKEVLHVPMLIRFPNGENGGTRVANDVSLVDIVPTIEAVLGADWGADFRGISLTEIAEQKAPRWIYADTFNWRALYLWPHKLIQYVEANQPVQWEKYFQYETDFREENPQDPDEAAIDDVQLDAMRTILRETYSGNRPGDEIQFDPATTEQLKALGYL